MTEKAQDIKDQDDNALDYDEALELTGHGWYSRAVLVTSCVVANAAALDMFGFSVVVAAARCDLRLAIEDTGLLVSAPFAGLLLALPWGYFADVQGRRRALLLCTSIGFVFAALSSLATSWQAMLVFKLVGCCFSVPGSILTVAYLGESTGSARRSRYLFYMNSMNLASEIVSFSLALFVLPLTINIPLPFLSINFRSWRLYTLILALPLGLATLMIIFLHESPKFLANAGRPDEALDVMRKIYIANGGKKSDYPVQSLRRVESRGKISFFSSVVKQTVPLFKPPLLWRTLQLSLLMAVCCSTNNVFFVWYPTMVNIFFNSLSNDTSSTAGFCQRIIDNATIPTISATAHRDDLTVPCDDTINLNVIYSGLIIGIFVTLLNLSVALAAAHKRLVLIAVLLVASASCVLVGSLTQPLASLLFFALIQTTGVGLGSVSAFIVDLYPTSYRGLATSLAVMLGRCASLTGIIAIGNVITSHCSLTFYLWALIVLCGVGVSLFLPSDRKACVNS